MLRFLARCEMARVEDDRARWVEGDWARCLLSLDSCYQPFGDQHEDIL